MRCLKKLEAFLAISIFLAFASFCYIPSFAAPDIEQIYNSVVVITSGNSQGSGFAIGQNAILTNAHVIGDQSDINISTYSKDTYTAKVYNIDEDLDLCLLVVEDANFTPIKLVSSDSVKAADTIYALGAPEGLDFTVTKGIVSNSKRELSGHTYIQIDAAINSGNSGGPTINEDGNVIGINSKKRSDSDGIGFAIPSSTVIDYLSSNGITLTDGIIAEKLTVSENTTVSNDTDVDNSNTGANDNTMYIAVIILLAILLIIAVAVIIILASKISKLKNNINYLEGIQRQKQTEKERDFEIEILD